MLKIITIEQEEKWNNIVKSFKNYDVSYLSGYVKAFQHHGEGVPLLFYFDNGSTRGINVVMKRDIGLAKPFAGKLSLNTWFDLSSPYGYGGFLIEGEEHETVIDAYDMYCKDKGFVSEFVRFHLYSGYSSFFSGLIETNTHNVVRSLELPLEDMLMDFEHRFRKSLKKANKVGLQVKIDNSGENLEDFLGIYYGTMERNNAHESYHFSKTFFNEINKLNGNYVYIHALYEEKIISTELVLYGPDNCYSFLGGTNKDYYHLQANTYLKYEIMKWAKEAGLKRFILGGGYGDDDGIFKYKKSMAPKGVVDFYIGKKVFSELKYNELIEIRKQEENYNSKTLFFPAYRG